MAKERITIPQPTADALMFHSNGTCCKCREEGKSIQIHHIDENPSNNDPANLAVLCVQCHDLTQISGGFSRKLNAGQVVQYRDDWHTRVQKRRDDADKIAVSRHSGSPIHAGRRPIKRDFISDADSLRRYIETLPAIRQDIYRRAGTKWQSANGGTQREGTSDVNDVLAQILTELASWYPERHFNDQEPQHYISSLVVSRHIWHRALFEPNGRGTEGSIVRTLVPGMVMEDLESMIDEMVASLGSHVSGVNYEEWKKRWRLDEHSSKVTP